MLNIRSYPFKIGQFDCWVLLDGASMVDLPRFLRRFPEGTEPEYRQAYAAMGLSLDAADSSFNVLLARTDTETMLVDAGEGGRPAGGALLKAMELAGVTPDEVTQVVITHSHCDHVLGLLADDDTAAFPNATYIMSQAEMAFWQGAIDSAGAYAEEHRRILRLMDKRGLRLIDKDEQIVPGITAVPLPGHTPGQMGLLLESEGERLLHLADVLHSPMQFAHPEWSARFDVDTDLSVPTRRAALQRAADENLLALFYHLTFPGLGRVKQGAEGFTWEPL